MPRAALAWLWFTLLVGLAGGWGQMIRGAHHVSHSVWTGWICWALTTLSFYVSQPWREGCGRAVLAPDS